MNILNNKINIGKYLQTSSRTSANLKTDFQDNFLKISFFIQFKFTFTMH